MIGESKSPLGHIEKAKIPVPIAASTASGVNKDDVEGVEPTTPKATVRALPTELDGRRG